MSILCLFSFFNFFSCCWWCNFISLIRNILFSLIRNILSSPSINIFTFYKRWTYKKVWVDFKITRSLTKFCDFKIQVILFCFWKSQHFSFRITSPYYNLQKYSCIYFFPDESLINFWCLLFCLNVTFVTFFIFLLVWVIKF